MAVHALAVAVEQYRSHITVGDAAKQAYERMIEFTKELDRRGLFKGAESLRSVASGARVEKRGGKVNLFDGPFAEAKEIVGGFILVDCATKEEALALAQECPASEWSMVEVREVGPCYLG